MEKMTQRDFYNQIKANYPLTADEIAFIDGRIAQLDKKSGKHSDAPTATQIENAKLADEIVAWMAGVDGAVTIAMVRKHFDLSPQKVTPIMGNLVDAGRVAKTVEKRTSYFTVVNAD